MALVLIQRPHLLLQPQKLHELAKHSNLNQLEEAKQPDNRGQNTIELCSCPLMGNAKMLKAKPQFGKEVRVTVC